MLSSVQSRQTGTRTRHLFAILRDSIVTESVGASGWKHSPQMAADFAALLRSSYACLYVRPRRLARASRSDRTLSPARIRSLRVEWSIIIRAINITAI